MKTFEDFLMNKCPSHTNNSPEGFEKWLENRDIDEMMDYAEEYNKQSLTDHHNHIVESEHNKILNILNYWKAETDEGSQEIDKLFLHLKNYFQESPLLQDTNKNN